jgi:hypothetical protein
VTPAGGSPKRNFADVSYISRFVRRCDVVAVQEVRGNLRALCYLLKALGDDWVFILTDVTKGSQGNDERLAFLFDTKRVKPSGLAYELVVWIEDAANVSALDRQFARTPYAVSFLSSGQTVILVTLHVDCGKHAADRVPLARQSCAPSYLGSSTASTVPGCLTRIFCCETIRESRTEDRGTQVRMATARPAYFSSSDGKTNVTQRVAAAFWDEGIPVLVPGPEGFEIEEAGAAPSSPALPADKVWEMLGDAADWKLVADVDDKTKEILTKKDLGDQLGEGASKPVAKIVLRPISPSEKLLVDAIPKLYGLDVSYDRLKEALSLPVAQAGLVATGAGLFGLLALSDKITHPDAMGFAVIFAAAAVALSLVGRYWLREVTLKPARLDLVRERYLQSIREPLQRSRAGLFLLLCAIGLALYSTWPRDGKTDAKATITAPTVTQTSEGISAGLKVTWKNLAENVANVRTVVQTGEPIPITQTSPKATDGTAESDLEFKIAKAGTLVVTSTALDSGGSAIGSSASKEFKVP